MTVPLPMTDPRAPLPEVERPRGWRERLQALRYLPAYVVNLTTLGEPVGATLLAALIPGIAEIPTIATVIGGAMMPSLASKDHSGLPLSAL